MVFNASAQGGRTEITIGLQNDMTNMNSFNPETNTVWNFYQTQMLTFETLLGHDPDFKSYPVLADPDRTPQTQPGYYVNTTSNPKGLDVDVYIRQGVTFQDGQLMNADDVVFTYQTLAWSTYSTLINEALWWPEAKWAHWDLTGTSHIGIEKLDNYTVRFHLYKPYALFFFGTLETSIIPKHIWMNHINPDAPVDYLNPSQHVTNEDRSIDFAFGKDPSETQATIGTGYFKFDYWRPKQESHLTVYDNYWGKGNAKASHVWKGQTYYFYPEHLRSIRFLIFSSLDVISLALQKGDIDTLIWSLTPGFLAQVKFNPAISVEQVTDAGFFYLSFNLRKNPWGNSTYGLELRKAISMAIDKDYIVNTLMGGFGIKGTVPISVHNPLYVNSSASFPSFDLAGAKAVLDAAGIVDKDGDGWRDTPDGQPIKTTILTPPKDYDPVRADAGIMIANNLKKIGLNIDSAPTSFDTIVAKAFSAPVDFDIYILGWLLGDFPESYIKDFFHSSQDVNINPSGSNSAGYHNPQVDALIDEALKTLDTTKRVKLIQDIEGIVDRDIPWNVLYYRKNLNAYRNDRWVGWVNTPPQIYNFWSLTKLRPAGAVVVPPPSGPLNLALTVPERAIGGHTIPVDAFVSQGGVPVSGAAVNLTAAFGSESRTIQATTDVGGHARFMWRVPVIQGNLLLTATATKDTVSASSTKLLQVTVGPPAPIATLTLSSDRPVIGPGESTAIKATLFDGTGAPMPGVEVSVDTTLLLGTVTPNKGVTDAAGTVTFTYQAPATAEKFTNQHLVDIMKASVQVPDTVATGTQSASMVIFVQNDNPPDWLITTVQDLGQGLVLAPGDKTTITVKVTDFTGAAKEGVSVEAVVGNSTLATASPSSNNTDSSGNASFTVTANESAPLGSNVDVRFRVANRAFQVSDQVELLISDGTVPGYAAVLRLDNRSLASAPTPGSSTATVTVFDQSGLPVQNAQVIFQITYGDLGLPAQFPWRYDYANTQYLGQGLDLNSFGLGSLGPSFANSAVIGDPTVATAYGVENFVEDSEVVGDIGVVDSCDPTTYPAGFEGTYYVNTTGLTDANGQVSGSLTALPHKLDSPVQVRAYIGKPGETLRVAIDACNFVAKIQNAAFSVDSGLVIQRAPVFALGSVTTDQPILTSEHRIVQLTAKFYAKDGASPGPVQVFLIRGAGRDGRNVGDPFTSRSGTFYGTLTTDAEGVLRWNVSEQYTKKKVAGKIVDTDPLSLSQQISFSFIPADPKYAYGGRDQLFGQAFGDYWFSPTFAVLIAKIPFEWSRGYLFVPSEVAFADVQVDKTLVGEGGSVEATVTVTTGTGKPIANATLIGATGQALTDEFGRASLNFSTTLGAIENLMVIQTPDGQLLRAWAGTLASRPVLTVTSITVAPAPAGRVSTITASIQNLLAVSGPAVVTLNVDGTDVVSLVVNIDAGATKTVTFRYVFDSAGTHQLTIGDKSQTVDIQAPAPNLLTEVGIPTALLFVGLIVGTTVGLILGRRRRPPTMMRMEPPQAP